ncbi:MAG: IPExxxVDY family protein [Bacteroidales bacterium]|nr:IPExxxVDY family protein [Bacteroidales bacterium]
MTNKIKIEFNLTNDYYFIGILTELKMVKLAWLINKYLNVNFRYFDCFKSIFSKTTKISFPVYIFYHSYFNCNYFLVHNTVENFSLIKEFKNFNYIIFCSSEINKDIVIKQIEVINKLELIQIAGLLNIEGNKEINNFLSDFELFLLNSKPDKLK